MNRFAGAALGVGVLGTAALGAGSLGWLPGKVQELNALKEQGLQPTAEQEQAAKDEQLAYGLAALLATTGSAAAGTQLDLDDWRNADALNAAVAAIPEPVAAAPVVSTAQPQRKAGDALRIRFNEMANAVDQLMTGDAMPSSALASYRSNPAGYRRQMLHDYEALGAGGFGSGITPEQFERSRAYVREVLEALPDAALERAAAMGALVPVTPGLGENRLSEQITHRLPEPNIRAQADAFVASLPEPDVLAAALKDYDVIRAWNDGPDYDLAARIVREAQLQQPGKNAVLDGGSLGVLSQVLAADRVINNRLNHGWASAAMGALKQGGAPSVENYFRHLAAEQGQDLGDWQIPAALKQRLPAAPAADAGVDWSVINPVSGSLRARKP